MFPHDDTTKGVCRADHLRLSLDAAVRGGGDTDTVAAIAGGLLGAAYGALKTYFWPESGSLWYLSVCFWYVS